MFFFSYHEPLTFRSKFVNRDPWKNGIAKGTPCINIFYIIFFVLYILYIIIIIIIIIIKTPTPLVVFLLSLIKQEPCRHFTSALGIK